MPKDNPWKTLSTKETYRNPWFSVREDVVIRPDGEEGIYGVVETRIATGVVALDHEEHIYLVGQYRYPTDRYSWEIPEGGTDEGERPVDAARRELQEEAGLTAGELTQLGPEIQMSNCISSEVGYVYLARDLQLTKQNPDPTEVLAVRRVPLDQAMEMLTRGEISDSLSIIGLYRAREYLEYELQHGVPQ